MQSGIHPELRTLSIDNHALSIYRLCPAKWMNQIQQSLVLKPGPYESEDELRDRPVELSFGIALHKALDTLFLTRSVEKASEDFRSSFEFSGLDPKRNPGRADDILEQYFSQWLSHNDIPYEGLITEVPFALPLGQVEDSNHGLWEVEYSGVIDKIFSMPDGSFSVMDHKTTSWNSQSLTTTYELSSQFLGYAWGVSQGRETQESIPVWLDLILLNPKTVQLLRDRFVYTQAQITEWRMDVLETAREMIYRWTIQHFPRHGRDACVSYNRPCQFVEMCRAEGPRRDLIRESVYQKSKRWDPADRM